MNRQIQASVTAQVAGLSSMPMKELWTLWDAYFPRRPGNKNRHFVEARIAYKIQEQAYGALPEGIRRHLADNGAKYSKIIPREGRGKQISLMPGTQLRREWDDREYCVMVTPEGMYELEGRIFKSLSAVARHITGTQWSGPKFFGLLKQDKRGEA